MKPKIGDLMIANNHGKAEYAHILFIINRSGEKQYWGKWEFSKRKAKESYDNLKDGPKNKFGLQYANHFGTDIILVPQNVASWKDELCGSA